MPTPIEATPIDPSEDSWISEASPTTNYQSSNSLAVGLISGKATDDRRAVLRFDISSYLNARSHQLVTKVELYLYGSAIPFGMSNVYLRKLTTDFDPAFVTWNASEFKNNWTTAGGDHAGETDYPITPFSGGSTIDITDMVMELMKSGGTVLHLIIMHDSSPVSAPWNLYSLNATQADRRPELRFEYLEGGRRRKGISVNV